MTSAELVDALLVVKENYIFDDRDYEHLVLVSKLVWQIMKNAEIKTAWPCGQMHRQLPENIIPRDLFTLYGRARIVDLRTNNFLHFQRHAPFLKRLEYRFDGDLECEFQKDTGLYDIPLLPPMPQLEELAVHNISLTAVGAPELEELDVHDISTTTVGPWKVFATFPTDLRKVDISGDTADPLCWNRSYYIRASSLVKLLFLELGAVHQFTSLRFVKLYNVLLETFANFALPVNLVHLEIDNLESLDKQSTLQKLGLPAGLEYLQLNFDSDVNFEFVLDEPLPQTLQAHGIPIRQHLLIVSRDQVLV